MDRPSTLNAEVLASVRAEESDAETLGILREFHRLESHPLLKSSPNLIKILKFCLDCTLRGDTAQLKEYTIGVLALNRPESFDPQKESIVRTQVGKLRRKMEQIYETSGTPFGICLFFSKGTYKISVSSGLSRQTPAEAKAELKELSRNIQSVSVPSIAFLSPQNINGSTTSVQTHITQASVLIQLIREELAEFDLFQIARLDKLPHGDVDLMSSVRAAGIHYALESIAVESGGEHHVKLNLIQIAANIQLWSVDVALHDQPKMHSFARLLAGRIAEVEWQQRRQPKTSTKILRQLQGQLELKGWHYHRQLNFGSLMKAAYFFDQAAALEAVSVSTEIARVLNLITMAFVSNSPTAQLRPKVQVAFFNALAGCPQRSCEILALRQIVSVMLNWSFPDLQGARQLCVDLETEDSVVRPYYAFFVALPLGLHDECLQLLEKSMIQDSANPTIYTFRGWVQLAQEKFHEAAASFKEAIELEPRCSFAQEGQSRLEPGFSYTNSEAEALAESNLSELLTDSGFWNAQALGASGDFHAALQQLSQAIRRKEGRTLSVTFDPLFARFRESSLYGSFLDTMQSPAVE